MIYKPVDHTKNTPVIIEILHCCSSILQKLLTIMRHCGLHKISPCGTFSLSHQTPCTYNIRKVWHYVRQSVLHKTSPHGTLSISCQTCPAWPAYLENTAVALHKNNTGKLLFLCVQHWPGVTRFTFYDICDRNNLRELTLSGGLCTWWRITTEMTLCCW